MRRLTKRYYKTKQKKRLQKPTNIAERDKHFRNKHCRKETKPEENNQADRKEKNRN